MSWKTKKIAFVTLLAAIFTLQLGGDAHADNASILQKWTLSEYYNCMKDGKEVSPLKPKTSGKVVDSIVADSTKDRLMPSYNFQGAQNTSCKDLLSKSLDYGNSAAKNVRWNGTAGEAQRLLENTFYYTAEIENGGGEFQIYATKNTYYDDELDSTKEVQSLKITATPDENGTLVYRYSGLQLDDIRVSFDDDHHLVIKAGDLSESILLSNNFQTTYDAVKNALANKGGCTTIPAAGSGTRKIETCYTFNVDKLISSGDNVKEYTLGDAFASNTLKTLNGGNNSTHFDTSEIYDLYYYYLDKAIPNSGQNYRIHCGETPENTNNLRAIHLVGSDNTVQQCYINTNGQDISGINVNIIDVNTLHPTFKQGTMGDVIGWFDNLSIGTKIASTTTTGESNNQPTTNPDGETTTDGENGSGEQACYDKAGVMGWILCPVINMLQDAGNRMWNAIEEHLMVDSDLYKFGGEVNSIWSTMQGISNIVFIIIILMIIFSQVTGVGIDNYGIKKMLPRIIATAVLANLSFVICTLVLDTSNIVGSSLNSWLTNMSPALQQTGAGAVGETAGSIVGLAIGGGAYFLFEFLATGSWAGAGLGLALLVLTILLTIVVAMATLYITLIVRKALVIMVIIVAPVAIALYILPNTEKWFKRWLQISGALILLYPLCGLVVGGGKLAGNILASAGQAADTKSVIIAGMIAQVAPFFFIPTLLTNSMRGIGNIGGKIWSSGLGLGRRFSGATNRAVGTGIRNSERFKTREQLQKDNLALRRANNTIKRLGNRNNLSNAQRTQLDTAYKRSQEIENQREILALYGNEEHREAKRQSLQEELRRQRSKDMTTLASNRYREMGLEQLRGVWETAFRSGNVEELDAVTNVMTSRYGTSAANQIAQSLNGVHGIATNQNYQNSMRALQRTMTENTTFAGNMKNKASDAFQMISNAGARYDPASNSMVFEDLSYFSGHNTISTDIKDWSTQSAATLQRAMDNGSLTDEMVQNILNSTDPSIQSSIQSDPAKRDILQARMYNIRHNPNGQGPNPSTGQAAQLYRAEANARATAPTVVESGAYKTRGRNGRIVQLHRMSDGTFVDANSNQAVDVRNYTRQ